MGDTFTDICGLCQYIILGIGLLISAVVDIREKKIPVLPIGIILVCSVIIHACNHASIINMVLGGLTGLFFVGMSLLTKGKIGIGDGMIFIMTGVGLGIVSNIAFIVISFLLAAVWSMGLVVCRKVSRTYRIPFAPFQLCALLCIIILQIVN